jgi:hypothetical protein
MRAAPKRICVALRISSVFLWVTCGSVVGWNV